MKFCLKANTTIGKNKNNYIGTNILSISTCRTQYANYNLLTLYPIKKKHVRKAEEENKCYKPSTQYYQ